MKKLLILTICCYLTSCYPPVEPPDICQEQYESCGQSALNAYNKCYRSKCGSGNYKPGCDDGCRRDYELEVGECREELINCRE